MGERIMYECSRCGAEDFTPPPNGKYNNEIIICLECADDARFALNDYYELIPSTTTQNGG